MRKLLLSLLLLCPLLLAHPLADAGILGRGDPATHEDPAIVLQARAVAKQGDRMEAIAILEDYMADGGNAELMPWVAIEAGEQRRLSGDPTSARVHFERVARSYPDHPSKDAAILGLALLAFDAGNASGNTEATLGLVADDLAPPTMNADRYRLLALAAANEGSDDVDALVAKALKYAEEDPATASRTYTALQHLVPEDTTVPDAVDTADGDVAALNRAWAALRASDYERASELATSLQSTFPDSEYLHEATWIQKRADARDPYDNRRIGVLLPLTGKYAPPANQLKEALQMAVEDSGGAVQLVFRDTEGDPEKAKELFEELVLSDGVAAVVGPLLTECALAVAPEAQAAHVPLISLSQASGLTLDNDYVFRTWPTAELQVDGLLDYVMDKQGMTNFAMMAPDTDYGRAARDAFVSGVEQRGGSVTAIVMYDPTQTDYRKDAEKLGRKDYEARKSELYKLRKEAEDRGDDPSKVVLPPTVDFDAIFLPDSHTRVALVASALAYEEFAIGNFQPTKKATPVPLLGLNGWNNDELYKRGGLYVQNALFVDAFFGSDEKVEPWVEDFRNIEGRSPTVLDAVGYDTGRLVSVASRMDAAHRDDWREALKGAQVSRPVSGSTTFDDEGELSRRYYVLTIKRDRGIRLVDPLPPEPEAPPAP